MSMYDHDADILNPMDYARESAIGFASGLTLGGGQVGLDAGVKAINNWHRQSQNDPLTNATPQGENAEAAPGSLEWVKEISELGKPTNTSESRRLTEADMDSYMRVGERRHVRDTKQRILDNGESPILTKPAEIVDFICNAFRRKIQNTVKGYGRVNNRLANAVKSATNGDVNIDDYYLELDADKIAHISDHVKQDKDIRSIPLSEEQLEQLPEYIDNYDDLIDVIRRKDGSVRLMLGKKINGHSIILETVSKGRKSLHPVTAYQIDSADYMKHYKTRAIDRSSTSRPANADTVDISRPAIALNDSISQTVPGVNTNSSQAAQPDPLQMVQDVLAMGQGKENGQTVDTETQAEYDNVNNQGGVVNGTERAEQAYVKRGTEEDSIANQGATRTQNEDRSGIQGAVGEAGEGSGALHIPERRNRGLITEPPVYTESDYCAPDDGSALKVAKDAFKDEYGIDCHIIRESAWVRDNPAYTYKGSVYISEGIDDDTLSTAVPHETNHAMKQHNFKPYLDFTKRTPDMLPLHNEATWELLRMAARHRGVDVFEMSDTDLIDLYDELNAIVYGMHKSGILKNAQYGYDWISGAFTDFDGYIAELDNIHELFKQLYGNKNGNSIPPANPTESVGAAPSGFDPNSHLQYQYRTLPDGKNAVRPDDLPVSTDGNNRVSQTAVTVKGAKVTSDEFADLLMKDVKRIDCTGDGSVCYIRRH